MSKNINITKYRFAKKYGSAKETHNVQLCCAQIIEVNISKALCWSKILHGSPSTQDGKLGSASSNAYKGDPFHTFMYFHFIILPPSDVLADRQVVFHNWGILYFYFNSYLCRYCFFTCCHFVTLRLIELIYGETPQFALSILCHVI